MAARHVEPRDAPLLGRLSGQPPDNFRFYGEHAARWYAAEYEWKDDDIPFYVEEARRWAGEGGYVLELAAGAGRVTLPLARAGFRVTALDVSPQMLAVMGARLEAEDPGLRARVEVVEQDMRGFSLDRLFRFIYLPFNTFLVLAEPRERQRLLGAVRAHLAPSGAFAFDVFTPDPRVLGDVDDWRTELEHTATDPETGEQVDIVREVRGTTDLLRQVRSIDFRHRVSRNREVLAEWEDHLDLAFIFPRELELILEREGFVMEARYGGPDRRPYAPRPELVQQAYVVARLAG